MRVVTFALHPLAEEALQQTFAELTDGGTGVGVNGEGVRDFDPTQDNLLHPDGTTAQQGVTLPGTNEGALHQLRKKGGKKNLICGQKFKKTNSNNIQFDRYWTDRRRSYMYCMLALNHL